MTLALKNYLNFPSIAKYPKLFFFLYSSIFCTEQKASSSAATEFVLNSNLTNLVFMLGTIIVESILHKIFPKYTAYS